MKDLKYDDTIIELEKEIRHLCTVIKQKGREILTDFEITPPQFEALQYLINEDNLTIGELSNQMFLACSTITDLVDRMEKNMLVKRTRDEKDRRVVRIIVLEKGHQLINEVLHARRNYLAELLKDLTQAQKDQILQGIGMVYGRTV
ncbi:MarR family winged helix-turn-helix transcriptional regulator [Alkaliphilus peptidifermentans]|uniref:DNA-binding transcriptional regulator, MarR family n=1 Tax=Alkaliphilus peptidifermentans DSM 18978 TaxID=1120976 RepID=A0A1G5CQY2_9FIRM|nr:MarR family transcriptional regulator [Alkaliphilus peptidifermentans]SCY04717.1 DNA-binding transcriptional regulator, MarR family [Alkaliphilus peptidifermentans DSM 18978]